MQSLIMFCPFRQQKSVHRRPVLAQQKTFFGMLFGKLLCHSTVKIICVVDTASAALLFGLILSYYHFLYYYYRNFQVLLKRLLSNQSL
mgnify:FL=1